jgi:membrane protein
MERKLIPVAAALIAGLVAMYFTRRHPKHRTYRAPPGRNNEAALDVREPTGFSSTSGSVHRSPQFGGDAGMSKGDAATDVPLNRVAWWKGVAKSVGKWWSEEHVANKAAALSFYTAFSLAPIVLLLMLLFGVVIDTQTLQTQLLAQATSLLGEQGGTLIEGMLEQANSPKRGWSAVFGILLAAFGATTVFAELKGSLDDLLAKQAPENTTFWQTIRARILSFGIVITLGFLLLVSLLANAMLTAVSGVMTRYLDTEAVWIGRLIAAVITFLGTFGLFYLIYRLLPERKLSRTALLIGAVASTILFSVGRIGIGFYLGHTDALKAFGAAGSLAVVLIWVYYSALAFFVGALIGRYVEESHAAGSKSEAKEALDKNGASDPVDDKAAAPA